MWLLFTRHLTPASFAICLATGSQWSHVACQIGDTVYEAKASCGVRQTDFATATAGASAIGLAVVDCNDHLARRWMLAQLGKPYDWSAIWTWYGSRDWQQDDAWYCSEFVATACVAGNRRVVFADVARVTPGRIWRSPMIERI